MRRAKETSQKKGGKGNLKLLRISKAILEFLNGRGCHPLSEEELMERLGVVPENRELFLEALRLLTDQGKIRLDRMRYSGASVAPLLATGILHVNRRGFGFLEPSDKHAHPQDIFIPKSSLLSGVEGDTVEVAITPGGGSPKGPEGRVVAILKRGQSQLAGTVIRLLPGDKAIAYAPLLGPEARVLVDLADQEVTPGSRLVMTIDEWGSSERETLCTLASIVGHIDDPSCDIEAACAEFQLRTLFPSKAVEEAESAGSRVSKDELEGRVDLRETECVTIDPASAKDFDDALSLSKDAKGHYHLLVHIADVTHYVPRGSMLDEEAKLRSNSTYFPNTCVPMLPPALSDHLCSLKPNVIRLAVSVQMEFNPKGELLHHSIFRSAIKSKKRFSYDEALEVLEGRRSSPHAPMLHLMVELCGLLKGHRRERGSVEFALPELALKVEPNGVPIGTYLIEYDITHQMVEEFMLKANEVVATHLGRMGKGLAYRVHEAPDEEHLKDFAILSSAFGFKLPNPPTLADIQALFDVAAGTPDGYHLAVGFIRSMKMAIYSPDNIGHYGLSLEHYCHFTSPIRRYADLVVHRVLLGDGYTEEELDEITKNCSEKERISARAENSVLQLKKLRLLASWMREDPTREFEGAVTRVKAVGISFELVDLLLEGFLHVSDLSDDYYLFDAKSLTLTGQRTERKFSCGSKILLIPTNCDLILRETRFALPGAEEGERRPRAPSRAKARRRSSKRRS